MSGLVDLNVKHVCKALRELSVVINFISNGKADVLQDGEAWDMRMKGGLQFFRLHTMISPDQLALTAVDGYKLELLQNAWRSVESLQHSAHLEALNVHHCSAGEYRGPLFLPGEVGPDGQFRKSDEVVDAWLDLSPDLDDGLLHEYLEKRPDSYLETKQESGESVASELKEHADQLELLEEELLDPIETDETPSETTWTPKELATELDVTTRSINTYAKMANCTTPGRGKRNHRYSNDEKRAMLEGVINNASSDPAVIAKAKKALKEMETKPKNGN